MLAMVALAACRDPIVDVAVSVPTAPRDYGSRVAAMTVRVLAPQDDAIDCDAIAFGEIADDAIELAQVTAVSVRGGRGAIEGVPRLGRKLFLAEGRTDTGTAVVAGCQAHGDIDDDTTVAIATEPTVVIGLDGATSDLPVPATLAVRIDDGLATPLPIEGRELRWEIYGAAGERLRSADPALRSDASGAVTLALTAPAGYGPASIQIRARWARDQPAVRPAFQEARQVALGINQPCTGDPADTLEVATAQWQAVRSTDGRLALVGLARDATRTHLFAGAWSGQSAVAGCSVDLGAIAAFTILRATPADPIERVLILDHQAWIEYAVVAQATSVALVEHRRTPWTTTAVAVNPAALVTVRDCASNDPTADYVIAEYNDGTIVPLVDAVITPRPFATALGALLEAADGPETPLVSRSGCIAQGPSEPALPALVLQTPRREAGATVVAGYLVIDEPVTHFAGLAVPSFGAIAFTPVAIGEPLLLGGTFEPSGAHVLRWRLTRGAAGLELREVVSDDAAGPPASIAVGDLDGDDVLDTVWGLVDAVPGGVEEARIQISLGSGAGTVALNSLSRAVASSAAAVFFAPEADGTADLMIGGSRLVVGIDADAR